jgi:hypothetical protein
MSDWEPPTVHPEKWPCTCAVEGLEEANRVREYVKDALGADESDLVTRIVYDLNSEYGVEIVGIHCDQWGAVRSERWYPIVTPPEKKPSLFMQCDRIEDGFIYTWLYWKQETESEKSRNGATLDAARDEKDRLGHGPVVRF